MNKYDENYSAYFAAPDKAYPVGSAVDATNEDNLDGTPILAAFFNDVIGFMQATFFGVYGTDAQVSNSPDSCVKSDVWNAIQKFVGDKVQVVKDAVAEINGKIPPQASAENQLADKDFVNSSISTNTAYFIGTFDSPAALKAYAGTKTNNDYAFVQTTDSAGNTIYNRYKWNGSAWLFEYALNNSSFTSNQWAAINSGATVAKINQIKNMKGATQSAAGAAGFVPQPPAGAQGKFLRGDGVWTDAASVVLQAAFDAAHPVGSTYTQYPQQDEPNSLFNKNGVSSSWSIVNYSGAFFRAAGGNAATFKEKTDALTLQKESVPNITSTFRLGTHGAAFEGTGAVYYKSGVGEGSKRGNTGCELGFDASKSNAAYGRRSEVAPANYTIRVWKRKS